MARLVQHGEDVRADRHRVAVAEECGRRCSASMRSVIGGTPKSADSALVHLAHHALCARLLKDLRGVFVRENRRVGIERLHVRRAAGVVVM